MTLLSRPNSKAKLVFGTHSKYMHKMNMYALLFILAAWCLHTPKLSEPPATPVFPWLSRLSAVFIIPELTVKSMILFSHKHIVVRYLYYRMHHS